MTGRIPAHQGMLCHMIKYARPDLVKKIEETQEIETIVVGLGRQGTRHAGLMRDFGSTVTAGIAAGRGGQRIHEVIPVKTLLDEMVKQAAQIMAQSQACLGG